MGLRTEDNVESLKYEKLAVRRDLGRGRKTELVNRKQYMFEWKDGTARNATSSVHALKLVTQFPSTATNMGKTGKYVITLDNVWGHCKS